MKIAYLLGSLHRGGTETLLLDIFRNADHANFEFIGIHRKDGALKNDFYASEQKFIKLAPKFSFDISYFLKLRKLLKKENIQIAHTQMYLDALYAKIATFGTKIKVIQTFHGFEAPLYPPKEGKFSLSRRIEGRILKFIIKKTDKNFFVSDYQKELYTKKYNLKQKKQSVVYNGISFEKIDSACHCGLDPQSLAETGNSCFSSNNAIKLGAVGNFNSVRDQMTICRFLNLLNRQNIDFQFVFAGAKIESEALMYDNCYNFCKENNLLEKVHFLGSRNDVPAILKQLDAFIYSTDHDTFGIAVIEAIACGTPVFVNDWAVMQEITENGKYANIYKTKDENDLLQKFLLFLQNKNEYIKNAEKSSIAVREKFSIKNHLSNLYVQYKFLNPKS